MLQQQSPPFDVVFEAEIPFVIPTACRERSATGPAGTGDLELDIDAHRLYDNCLYDEAPCSPCIGSSAGLYDDHHRTYHFHYQPTSRLRGGWYGGDGALPFSSDAPGGQGGQEATPAVRDPTPPGRDHQPGAFGEAACQTPLTPATPRRPAGRFASPSKHPRSPSASSAPGWAASAQPPSPAGVSSAGISLTPRASPGAARSPYGPPTGAAGARPAAGGKSPLRTASASTPARSTRAGGGSGGGRDLASIPAAGAAGASAASASGTSGTGVSPGRRTASNGSSGGGGSGGRSGSTGRRRVNLLEVLKREQQTSATAGAALAAVTASGPVGSPQQVRAAQAALQGHAKASRPEAPATAALGRAGSGGGAVALMQGSVGAARVTGSAGQPASPSGRPPATQHGPDGCLISTGGGGGVPLTTSVALSQAAAPAPAAAAAAFVATPASGRLATAQPLLSHNTLLAPLLPQHQQQPYDQQRHQQQQQQQQPVALLPHRVSSAMSLDLLDSPLHTIPEEQGSEATLSPAHGTSPARPRGATQAQEEQQAAHGSTGVAPQAYDTASDDLVRQLLALVQTQATQIRDLKSSVVAATANSTTIHDASVPGSTAAAIAAAAIAGGTHSRGATAAASVSVAGARATGDSSACNPGTRVANSVGGEGRGPLAPAHSEPGPIPPAALPLGPAYSVPSPLGPTHVPSTSPLRYSDHHHPHVLLPPSSSLLAAPPHSTGGASDTLSHRTHDSASESSSSRRLNECPSVGSCSWAWGSREEEASSGASAAGSSPGEEPGAAGPAAEAGPGGGQVSELREQVCRLAHVVMAMQLTQEHMAEGLLELRAARERHTAGETDGGRATAEAVPPGPRAEPAAQPDVGRQSAEQQQQQQQQGRVEPAAVQPPLAASSESLLQAVLREHQAQMEEVAEWRRQQEAQVAALRGRLEELEQRGQKQHLDWRGVQQQQQEVVGPQAISAGTAAEPPPPPPDRHVEGLPHQQQHQQHQQQQQPQGPDVLLWLEALSREVTAQGQEVATLQDGLRRHQAGSRDVVDHLATGLEQVAACMMVAAAFQGPHPTQPRPSSEAPQPPPSDPSAFPAAAAAAADEVAITQQSPTDDDVEPAALRVASNSGDPWACPQASASAGSSPPSPPLSSGFSSCAESSATPASSSDVSSSDACSCFGHRPATLAPPPPDTMALAPTSTSAAAAAVAMDLRRHVRELQQGLRELRALMAAQVVVEAAGTAVAGASAGGVAGRKSRRGSLLAVPPRAGRGGGEVPSCLHAWEQHQHQQQSAGREEVGSSGTTEATQQQDECWQACPQGPGVQNGVPPPQPPPHQYPHQLQELQEHEQQQQQRDQLLWQKLHELCEAYEELRNGEALMAQAQEALVDLVSDLRQDMDRFRRRATTTSSRSRSRGSSLRSHRHSRREASRTSGDLGALSSTDSGSSSTHNRNSSRGSANGSRSTGSSSRGASGKTSRTGSSDGGRGRGSSVSATPGGSGLHSSAASESGSGSASVGSDADIDVDGEAVAQPWAAGSAGALPQWLASVTAGWATAAGMAAAPSSSCALGGAGRGVSDAGKQWHQQQHQQQDEAQGEQEAEGAEQRRAEAGGATALGGLYPREGLAAAPCSLPSAAKAVQQQQQCNRLAFSGTAEAVKQAEQPQPQEEEEEEGALLPLASRHRPRGRHAGPPGSRRGGGRGAGGSADQVSEMMAVIQHVNSMLSSSLAQALARIAAQGEDIAQLKRSLLLAEAGAEPGAGAGGGTVQRGAGSSEAVAPALTNSAEGRRA